ncbi:MAG TPA: hypothetical protein VMR06_04075 [Dokdonella sp.]|uniref:hypothetical protein n=1 Tax=Dokdonella sp. TaxID=2291710 RepID=UPI002B709CCE|nr:hypothetical protein [Dokdonella sp.]HUD41155.1 hypothetical protein [Dokdonella sp.]
MSTARWLFALVVSALSGIGSASQVDAQPGGSSGIQSKQAVGAIKVTEVSILPDGKESSETYYMDAAAHSFRSSSSVVTNGDGSLPPETPDPPPGNTPSGVSRVTYHQTGGGYERTTIYGRDWIPSASRWSPWRMIEDRLSECVPTTKCFGVLTHPS